MPTVENKILEQSLVPIPSGERADGAPGRRHDRAGLAGGRRGGRR